MGLMFLQHGRILSWGKTTRAMKDIPIPISERAVEVGLERASTLPPTAMPSDYPFTSHIAIMAGQVPLHHPKIQCARRRA